MPPPRGNPGSATDNTLVFRLDNIEKQTLIKKEKYLSKNIHIYHMHKEIRSWPVATCIYKIQRFLADITRTIISTRSSHNFFT